MAQTKPANQQTTSKPATDKGNDAPKKPPRSEGEKRGKFLEIAERRVNNACTVIRRLQPLANRQQYSYTDEQVAAMITTLRKELADVEQAFAKQDKKRDRFTF